MGLDPRYIPINSLQEYFVDKDSGFPLAAGKIYFWEDQARTIPKPVYQITGSPPNYTYSVLPNPVTLSSVGTFADDSGNDIMGYYFPYDISGNLELYYVTVYSAGDVFQFSREGQPNLSAENPETNTTLTNYIYNGQFIAHVNQPDDGLLPTPPGGTGDQVFTIAPGVWTFSRPNNSTAIDYVTFDRFNAPIDNPTGNPRYALTVTCESPSSGDSHKNISYIIRDVGAFTSDIQIYTLSFTARSNTGSNLPVNFVLSKFFGIGGSPTALNTIETITLTPDYQIYNIPFTFGSIDGYTLGPNNDDRIGLEIWLPTTFIFSASFTDFMLTPGDIDISAYPPTPVAEDTYKGICGNLAIPDYDGFDMHLPVKITNFGLEADHSQIGHIDAGMYDTPNVGELLCDASFFETAGYSNDGIPYRRLFDVIYDPGFGGGMFGTGYGNLTCYRYAGIGSTPYFLQWNNSIGVATAASDGAIPTGFTFMEVYTGGNQYFLAYYGAFENLVYAKNLFAGIPLYEPDAGTTTFTFTKIREGNSKITALYGIGNINESTFTAGSYFLISSTATNYYVWFKKNGVGTDPAVVGRTGIMINMPSGADPLVYNIAIQKALRGNETSYITATAGSTIPAGSYFNAHNSLGSNFYIWMSKDGIGTDPNVSGSIGIKCDIFNTDSNTQIANEVTVSVNGKYFAVPDLRGVFLRMKTGASNVDPDANYRSDRGDGIGGNNLGTIEDFEVQSHEHFSVRDIGPGHDSYGTSHSSAYAGGGGGGWGNGNLYPNSTNAAHTDWTGGNETRPVNVYVNYFIKY
jgi:hypothetical protein